MAIQEISDDEIVARVQGIMKNSPEAVNVSPTGMGENQRRVLLALKTAGLRGLTRRELLVAAEIKPKSLNTCLSTMARKGMISRIRYGVYRMPDAGDEVPAAEDPDGDNDNEKKRPETKSPKRRRA